MVASCDTQAGALFNDCAQSTKEEIASGLIEDIAIVRDAAEKLKLAVVESRRDVGAWSGRFPFGRADISIHCWKL
jgi:hypothetical protein